MSDLTKLTADELLDISYDDPDKLAEVSRRLELVEKLQHAARKATIDIVLLKERLEQCEAALRYIEAWKFPSTDLTWNDGTPMSYGAAYGSNGERDHMRDAARAALEGK